MKVVIVPQVQNIPLIEKNSSNSKKKSKRPAGREQREWRLRRWKTEPLDVCVSSTPGEIKGLHTEVNESISSTLPPQTNENRLAFARKKSRSQLKMMHVATYRQESDTSNGKTDQNLKSLPRVGSGSRSLSDQICIESTQQHRLGVEMLDPLLRHRVLPIVSPRESLPSSVAMRVDGASSVVTNATFKTSWTANDAQLAAPTLANAAPLQTKIKGQHKLEGDTPWERQRIDEDSSGEGSGKRLDFFLPRIT